MCVRHHSTAPITLAILTALGAVPQSAAQSTPPPGYTYVTRATTIGFGNQRSDTSMLAHTWVLGDSARVDVKDGDVPFVTLVTTDGGRTLALIDPAEHTYYVIEGKALRQLVSTEMQNQQDGELEQTRVSPGESSLGDTLLGFAVEHRRAERSVRSNKKGDSTSSTTKEYEETQEWWTSADGCWDSPGQSGIFSTGFPLH